MKGADGTAPSGVSGVPERSDPEKRTLAAFNPMPETCNLTPISDPREANMPDVTFVVRDIAGAESAEKLERALTRLGSVNLVNVDSEKGLVAVSYEGGEAELNKVQDAIENAGHEVEPSPGADPEVN